MRKILFASLAASLVLFGLSGDTFAQGTTSAFKKPAAPGTLSDEDIAALKQTFTDEKTKKSWTWSGGFSQKKLAGKDAERAKIRKKIPYRITAALYEVKEVRGKKTYKRESGTCWIFIKDAEGKVVYKTSQSLNKMCPS